MPKRPRCGEPSWAKVYWPGSDPLIMCAKHSRIAHNVATAMGMHLVQEDHDGGTCEVYAELAEGDRT